MGRTTPGRNARWNAAGVSARDERAAWGQRRRREALAALARLGVPAADARFLGWPDQGLTRLLLGDKARESCETLKRHVRDWRPTRLFVPALEDLHPDHNALAVFVRLAFDHPPLGDSGRAPEIFHYLVHGEGIAGADRINLPLFVWEKHAIGAAIAEHASQLLLSRRRFLSYATDEEPFAPPGPLWPVTTAVTLGGPWMLPCVPSSGRPYTSSSRHRPTNGASRPGPSRCAVERGRPRSGTPMTGQSSGRRRSASNGGGCSCACPRACPPRPRRFSSSCSVGDTPSSTPAAGSLFFSPSTFPSRLRRQP